MEDWADPGAWAWGSVLQRSRRVKTRTAVAAVEDRRTSPRSIERVAAEELVR